MVDVAVNGESIGHNSTTNSSSQFGSNSSTGMMLYNGSYHFVFKDSDGKEYILAEGGKKLYKEDIPLLKFAQMDNDLRQKVQKKYDEQAKNLELEKKKWEAKFKLANKNYDFYRDLKNDSYSKFDGIRTATKCKTLSQIALFDKLNGSNYYEEAEGYHNEFCDAQKEQRVNSSMSSFYGREMVKASKSILDNMYQEYAAQKMLGFKSGPSIFS